MRDQINEVSQEGFPEDAKTFDKEWPMLQADALQQWNALTDEQREDMLQQTQSVGYQQWMEEDDWDAADA